MFCSAARFLIVAQLLLELALQHDAFVDDSGDAIEKLTGLGKFVGDQHGRGEQCDRCA